MKELLEAGVHFGHQTKRWNPKMKEFIFGERNGMYFVNQRWLGGLLTNFTTIQRSLGRLRELEAMGTDGRYETLSKKEIARIEKEKRKLQKNLDGIRHMSRLPDAVFVV